MLKRCLVDASVLVSAYLTQNSQHRQAKKLVDNLEDYEKRLNILLAEETATVLLLRSRNIDFTVKIIDDLFFQENPLVKVELMSQELWQASYQVFANQSAHKLSFPDCSLIAQARLNDIKTIATLNNDLQQEFAGEFEFVC